MTNYVKVNIDNTQKNNKCRFCKERNETINYIAKRMHQISAKRV